jgi:ATP-utilising chromatin assembly and remodelling N-terminal
MMLYKQRSWTCTVTKKPGLTFLEALQSEQKASKKADPKFPGVWIKPCLEMIHLSVLPLSELVDTIYGYFRGTRFVTEHVFVDIPSAGVERSVERAVITEKLPNTVPVTLDKNLDKRQLQREAREALEDNRRVPEDVFHYRVSVVSKPKEYIIGPTQMRRPRQMLSKITFRNYIKDVAKKDKQLGSPWIVKVCLYLCRQIWCKSMAFDRIFQILHL